MVELKTLKDIKERYKHPKAGDEILGIDEMIKIEAIRWVKQFRKEIHTQDLRTSMAYGMREQAFMCFFNLAEEDLK